MSNERTQVHDWATRGFIEVLISQGKFAWIEEEEEVAYSVARVRARKTRDGDTVRGDEFVVRWMRGGIMSMLALSKDENQDGVLLSQSLEETPAGLNGWSPSQLGARGSSTRPGRWTWSPRNLPTRFDRREMWVATADSLVASNVHVAPLERVRATIGARNVEPSHVVLFATTTRKDFSFAEDNTFCTEVHDTYRYKHSLDSQMGRSRVWMVL